MSNSFQNEIPKARVNITLDVDTGGAQTKKELPMKLLMLGDYSGGKASDAVADRERISINKNNFQQVMQTFSPQVSVQVPNTLRNDGSELSADLTFNSIADFSPERVVEQVPALKKLLAMRNVLKDLKANILDNKSFKKELENILKNQHSVTQLIDELKQISPINSDEGASS